MAPKPARRIALSAAAAVCGLLLCAGPTFARTASTNAPVRPAVWAQPITNKCLPNLHRVTDKLYRGAQPEGTGFADLEKMGIRTIVNLRSVHNDKLPKGSSLKCVWIPMLAETADRDEIVRFLKVVADTNNAPIFVHCRKGADRTGLMCAVYRVAVCGWKPDDAVNEMRGGGFHFWKGFTNVVKLVKELDYAALRRDAGLPADPVRKD